MVLPEGFYVDDMDLITMRTASSCCLWAPADARPWGLSGGKGACGPQGLKMLSLPSLARELRLGHF